MFGAPVVYPLQGPDGTQTVPTYSFSSNPSTGFYVTGSGGSAVLHLAVFGTRVYEWDATASYILGSRILAFGDGADVQLTRDAAAVLALKNGGNAQAIRVYGTTTGPKYTLLSHDGTNGNVDVNSGALVLNASGGNVCVTSPTVFLNNSTVNGAPNLTLTLSGSLGGSPADWNCLSLQPQIAGAFTITRLNYLNLANQTGAATVTDAAVFRFDAAIGTHKALASNGAVASVFTANAGPAGAGTAIAGWIKWNINGTLRYTPFW